jgi:hypothetical protein
VGGAALLLSLSLAHGQQVHRNGFEAREPSWLKGTADAPFRETAHEMTDFTAHTGQYSEHIQLEADRGSFIYYVYPTGRAPVCDELSASLWVKSNRPGAQLLARLVLPRERSPNTLEDRLTTLLRGDEYQNVGRWQRLELRRPVKLARDQQQLVRADLKRDVDFTDAYIDRLVLNVYGGPGKTEIWIDDLEIGPVTERLAAPSTSRPAPAPGSTAMPLPGRLTNRSSVVELKQEHLLVSGKRFFMRGIRYSDTPLEILRDAGFNTIWFDYTTLPARVEQAVDLGFWVVPSLPVTTDDPRLSSPDRLRAEVTRFLSGDAVLFWDLGGGLVDEQKESVTGAAEVVHEADPQRPVGADIWDGFAPYSRRLDLIGYHRWPLMTTLELPQYRLWLEQRRLLALPGTFLWTWVQTHLPDWYTELVYERPASAGFQEPVGPQPEQIRLLTYTALAAGCRGLGFWSDRFLADSHQGRDRLLTLALLNLELQMLEPLLVSAFPPRWVPTSQPDVQAAVLRTEHEGLLVLPIWMGKGAQFVPGQGAASKLTIVVPEVPAGTQAWEVSPAEVRSLQTERVVGGTKVTLPEFGLTAAVVFTADNNPTGLIVRFQERLRRMRKPAAQWAHDLAEVELEKVTRVESQLEADGHKQPDGQRLLEQTRSRLRASAEYYNNGDYRQAYEEAQRTLRPLRILMRAQWEDATRILDSPVASPYAVSFFTLPRHWRLVTQVRQSTAGANVLRNGNFEGTPESGSGGWSLQQSKLDPVDLTAKRVPQEPKEGRQCLMLEIKPQHPAVPILSLERTFLAMQSPPVRLPPGTLVRISGWVRIPLPITASVDGVLFYDSAGGEPLAIRLTATQGWKKFTVFRQVPASGAVSVTLALTGLGKAFFDDVRVEPLVPTNAVQRTASR